MLGERGRVAIDGGRTGEDHTAHTRITGGDENVQGAIDVDLICLYRLLYRTGHGSARREVNDIVSALADFCEGLAVCDCAFNEGDFFADSCKVLLLAGREVVKDGDGVASADQFINGIRA